MNEKITTLEVLNAVNRLLNEEEKKCIIEFMNLPGLAKVLSTEEEYDALMDKLDYFINTWTMARRAVENIYKDIYMERQYRVDEEAR